MSNVADTYVRIFNEARQSSIVKTASGAALRKALMHGGVGLGALGLGAGGGYYLGTRGAESATHAARNKGYASGINDAETAYEDVLNELANSQALGLAPPDGNVQDAYDPYGSYDPYDYGYGGGIY